MANTNAPNGFRPIRHMTGGEVRTNEYSIASAYSSNIFKGDPVQMTGTGKNVALAEAGNVDNIGIFAGCSYVNASGEQVFKKYWPASTVATEVVAYVYDDPNIVYEAQCDTLAAADIGNLMDWAAGTGSTTTGNSGAYIDESTKATTGAAMRVLGLSTKADNAYGAYARAELVYAEHVLKGVVSGVGGV